MTVSYSLHQNPLTNGAQNYRAVIQFAGTVDLAGVIERMTERGSTITKADILAVLQDYHDTINDLVVQGFKVITPGANYGVSLKGNFADPTDSYDANRHRGAAQVSPGVGFRRAVQKRVRFQKQAASIPQPRPLVYYNYHEETSKGVLTPGGLARLNGYRLKFDPADPAQGIFLIAAANSVSQIEIVGRNTPNELIFLTPPDLTPGQYRLEVRACFGPNHLRSGQLQELLTVI